MSAEQVATVQDFICPSNAESITEDDGIKKLVVVEGHSDLPPLHARCLVHYIGRLADTGEVFMNSREESSSREPVKVIAGRHTVQREACLHLAAATMRPGETCRLWVEPRYGYGDRGSFSFPTVPPNAHLVYDLDLLSYDPPNDDDAAGIRDLTYEERLEAAERRRGEGNDAFRAGNHALALEKYTTALSYVDEDLLIQLEGFHYDKAMECRTPAILNMAAVHRKTGDHHAAVGLCSQVLAQDPDNVKALFRRGSARLSLGQTEAAIGDLQAARKRDPDDPGIVKELTAAMGVAKSEKSAQREMFGGMIARAGGRLFADVPEKIEKEVFMDDGALPPWNEGGSDGGLMGSVWKWILGVLSWMFPFLASKALVTGKAHAE